MLRQIKKPRLPLEIDFAEELLSAEYLAEPRDKRGCPTGPLIKEQLVWVKRAAESYTPSLKALRLALGRLDSMSVRGGDAIDQRLDQEAIDAVEDAIALMTRRKF